MRTEVPLTRTDYYRNVERQLDIDITLAARKLSKEKLHSLPSVMLEPFASLSDLSCDFTDAFFINDHLILTFINAFDQEFVFTIGQLGVSDKFNLIEALEKLQK